MYAYMKPMSHHHTKLGWCVYMYPRARNDADEFVYTQHLLLVKKPLISFLVV
jgi:hypothetical protein